MKTKSTLRACAWLLTLCTAIPVLASCGGDGTAAVETDAKTDALTETAVETEPLDALDARSSSTMNWANRTLAATNSAS